MAEYIDIIFKVGDGAALQDGMPVCYIDPEEWGYQPEYSDHMKKVFAIVRVNRTLLSTIKDVLKPYYSEDPVYGPLEKTKPGILHKARKACVDFSELENESKIVSLEDRLRSPSMTEVLVLPELSTSFLKDSKTLDVKGMLDKNSVTSGSYTVGSGKNYATWSAAFADIGNLGGDLTFTQQTAVTESATAITTATLGGFRLTCTSDYDHYGDPTRNSRLITVAHNADCMNLSNGGSGSITFSKLYWKVTSDPVAAYPSILYCADNTGDLTLTDLLQDKGGYHGVGIYTGGANQTVLAKNIAIGDSDMAAYDSAFRVGVGIKSDSYLENISVNHVACGIWLNGLALEVRNCAALDCGGGYGAWAWVSASTGKNNIASDASCADANWASGSGNITNRTAAESFLSTSTASSSYLDIDPNGPMDNAGIAPHQTRTTCIRNRAVPGPRGYCIGASESAKTGVNVVAAVLRQRM